MSASHQHVGGGESETLWEQLQTGLVRTRYRVQHGGLARSITRFTDLWHQMMAPGVPGPSPEQAETIERRYDALLAEDLRNVELGYYPRELLLQLPVVRYLRLMPVALLDAPRILLRSHRKRFNELPPGIDRSAYPRYYLRNFHWQTDGWLSAHSARMYDVAVEILFAGSADIMRRMALPPVVEAGRAMVRPRVLDVACGTGRFLLQLNKALPQARLYGLDLSPFYIKYAAELLRDVPDLSLVTDDAEAMPFGDDTFDIVTSVYLFHELPGDVRRGVAREMYRVLRPGGRLVICASAQRSESTEILEYLERFQRLYHEPYYKGFLKDPLEDILTEAGFEVESTRPHLVSKVVVATK